MWIDFPRKEKLIAIDGCCEYVTGAGRYMKKERDEGN